MTGKPPATIRASDAPQRNGSRYPKIYSGPCEARQKFILGDVFGLDQFGVNLAVLPPGAWASQRHWHEGEDEFIYVVDGELLLVDDDGEHVLTPGMCAGFKAGNGNGHHLKNASDSPATYLEVGTRLKADRAHFSDVDMLAVKTDGAFRFVKRDGSDF
ncbi:MAG: cupin domain-containing protein [Proteobacteria bacterium]|nr:cupin domain-containing protein [Pseudomonadota bacterium]